MSFPVFEAASRRTVENWAQGADNAGGGSGSGNSSEGLLPPDLSSYSPEQVKLICLSQVCCHSTPHGEWTGMSLLRHMCTVQHHAVCMLMMFSLPCLTDTTAHHVVVMPPETRFVCSSLTHTC